MRRSSSSPHVNKYPAGVMHIHILCILTFLVEIVELNDLSDRERQLSLQFFDLEATQPLDYQGVVGLGVGPRRYLGNTGCSANTV